MEASVKIRIQNITLAKPGLPRGKFLDLGGGNMPIPSGKSGYADKDKLSAEQLAQLEKWVADGDARIFDAKTGELIDGPSTAIIPPAQVSQVPASRADEVDGDDPFGDEEIDLSSAVEADIPLNNGTQPGQTQGAHAPDNQNVRQANVSTLGENTRQKVEHSPIPGTRPRSVDESEKFTITAPRTTGPGAVMGK